MAEPSSSSPPATLLLRHPLSSPTTRPPPDDLPTSWLLEFILRQPIPDPLALELFLSLPLSSSSSDLHPHLRKTLLLRRISSDLLRRSLSDRTVHSLELIADLDRHRGSAPSPRWKAAFAAAASLARDSEGAVRLVRDYLEEALVEMGPSFLEVAAAELVERKEEGAAEMNGCFEKLEEKGEGSAEQGGGFRGVGEVEVEDNEKGVNVGGHDMPDHSGCKIHQVDPGEISKVKDALKKSCFELKMVVEDPLPEAQAVAAAVLDSISRGHVLRNEAAKESSVENPVLQVSPVELVAGVPTGVDSSAGDSEKEKWNSSDSKQMEGNRIVKACNKDVGPSKRRVVMASHNLFERNPTAHTSEWSDDSLESSVPMDKLDSPNPMSRRISPTRLDKGKLVKRRAVKRWTALEEHTLREAVAKYGKGNWKLILNCHSEIFEERTEVDLKDKWRNMVRY